MSAPPLRSPPESLPGGCRIELLGGLRVVRDDQVLTRFRTHKAAALLSLLAYRRGRTFAREELAELLWPEGDPDAGRTNLRAELASLRRQLEPPGTAPGSILQADRHSIRLNPEAFSTDVAEFEAALRAASADPTGRQRHLTHAVELYGGDLLPGHYEDWVGPERDRLAGACLRALRQLTRLLEGAGECDRALEYAGRAVALDLLDEEARRDLMHMYLASGRPLAALHQYEELEQLLKRELGAAPSPAMRELASSVRRGCRAENGAVRPAAPRPRPGAGRTPARHRVNGSTGGGPAAVAPPFPRLPGRFNRFFGRAGEIETLLRLLSPEDATRGAAARLVTLTGPGGSGKTRLAMEAAWQVAEAWKGAVWFVPLASLMDPQLLPGALLAALGIQPDTLTEPLLQAAEFLRRQPSLLVLDNLEQLILEGEGAADGPALVQRLLELVPSLTCLATSRQRLGLEAERELAVEPLAVPPDPAREEVAPRGREGEAASGHALSGSPEALLRYPGVALFVNRAQAARPDFQVTARNAGQVAALCRRLEGIPLALELAAAWALVLTPAQMLVQLEDPFSLLVARRKGQSERHRTLHAALDWSYRLLCPEQQRFFAGLSVFNGGWTLEAAGVVCAARDPIRLLAQLRERSLILADETGSGMRFRMLETLREFGSEQLAPGERDQLSHRHASWCLTLAEEAAPQLHGAAQGRWLDRLDEELANFRAALHFCLSDGAHATTGLALATALWEFCWIRGHALEARGWLEDALPRAGTVPADLRARACYAAGRLARLLLDFEAARKYLEESLVIRKEAHDTPGIAQSLWALGTVAYNAGAHPAARDYIQQALAIYAELGDRWGIGVCHFNLSLVAGAQGEFGEAAAAARQSLSLRRELGDQRGIAGCLGNLGILAYRQGDHVTASSYLEQSLAASREVDDRPGVMESLLWVARAARARGDQPRALECLAEAMAISRKIGFWPGTVAALQGMAELAAAGRQWRQAARLLGAVAAQGSRVQAPLLHRDADDWNASLEAVRAALGEQEFAAAWAEGETLSLGPAVALAFTQD